MFRLDVIESRVRKCEDVSTIIDKKMRTRTIKFEKFIVPLTENNPFEAGAFVKVLRKSDFEKPSNTKHAKIEDFRCVKIQRILTDWRTA